MNKRQYLQALESELMSRKIRDAQEILEEYEEYFDNKTADGYDEGEIAQKLGAPQEIARQYAPAGPGAVKKSGANALKVAGLVVLDIVAALLYVVLLAWVMALGALSLACLAAGVSLVLQINIAGLIPYVPYGAAALLGVSMAALAALSAAGTVYCLLLLKQISKAYLRWHSNVIGGKAHLPMAKSPQMRGKARRRMRGIVMVSLAIFAVCSAVALIIMFALAGSLEPWHVWNWFV
ncbi:MAG: DUF1700 domain-containing protein [Christensenellales bacterium]|jgi:uncharacterized membrane protein